MPSFSFAGAMSSVWKPPDVFNTFACKAPAFSAKSLSFRTAFSVPAQENPLGKSSFAILHTAPLPSSAWASLHNCSNLGFSMPATESMACLPTAAASCMACPRMLTSLRPSSNSKTPAWHRAVYSPRERPAETWQRVTASSRSPRSFSTPARPAMNIAGWQNFVSSSLDSGPDRQSSNTSQPRIVFALESISTTLGMSLTVESIFTY
mmetsp:Transcript_74678/g.165161  ORF Transcript_74678/g.165161 Transcript_74678/m.165161 type:complete len:207 (+) Transcript_74678:459-1079(+)